MATHQTKKSGGSQPPTESDSMANNPKDPREQEQTKKEGDIRKVERNHNQKESYGDDFEVEKENEITQDEAKSEKANRAGRQ